MHPYFIVVHSLGIIAMVTVIVNYLRGKYDDE